jgi:hypothetical protein
LNVARRNKLAQDWLSSPNTWQLGNFTADGIVDANDLDELGQNWQQSIPEAASPESVPEPSGMALLYGDAVHVMMRFKRNGAW